MQENIETYIKAAEEKVKKQKEYFAAPPANDEFSFSSLPWISYTHISHTISGNREKSTPLFDWGKFIEREGRVILPFSVQVYYSFVCNSFKMGTTLYTWWIMESGTAS